MLRDEAILYPAGRAIGGLRQSLILQPGAAPSQRLCGQAAHTLAILYSLPRKYAPAVLCTRRVAAAVDALNSQGLRDTPRITLYGLRAKDCRKAGQMQILQRQRIIIFAILCSLCRYRLAFPSRPR